MWTLVNMVMNLQVPRNAGNVACFLPGRAKDISAPFLYQSVNWYECNLFSFILEVKASVKNLYLLYVYVLNKQRHIYKNILNHIALFFSNMFRQKKNTISKQVNVQMCDKTTRCYI